MLNFKPIALNQNTCESLELFKFIKFAKEFDGVELEIDKIRKTISKKQDLKDILEILEIYDTKVVSIYALSDFSLCSDMKYKTKILNNFKQMIHYCDKLESNLIIVNPSLIDNYNGLDSIPEWRILNKTRKRLEDITKRAYREDINIGFEFSIEDHSSISNLRNAKEVLKPIENLENLGYIIDSFYLAKYDVSFNELNDIRDLIFLIKLADFNEKSTENVERLFPGEGTFNFTSFHRFLEKLGYHKPFSLELSNNGCSEKFLEKFSTIFKY